MKRIFALILAACEPTPTTALPSEGHTQCWQIGGKTICRYDLTDGTLCYVTSGQGALSCVRPTPSSAVEGAP